ncbi:hypothetical protein E4188_22990 (plasmid) [Aeromonas media]|uniref:Uncharacterized protein n=1 Tax=Aeromonas media TaxID=651 RepID=A0ABX6NZY4_AERME|nr:hypothetical protein [Aeromonas media]QJT37038.1 hypothetical protein E4187_22350 [Aeromonas media]QJT41363.1 hypothetical protein E4188_22990 [Aeromonas media]
MRKTLEYSGEFIALLIVLAFYSMACVWMLLGDGVKTVYPSLYEMLVSRYKMLPVTAAEVGENPNGLDLIRLSQKAEKWYLTMQVETKKKEE